MRIQQTLTNDHRTLPNLLIFPLAWFKQPPPSIWWNEAYFLSQIYVGYFYITWQIELLIHQANSGGSNGKESTGNAGNLGSIPGLKRSPGERNGNPLQYSCLENPRTEESGGLQSIGWQRVGHNWAINTLNNTRALIRALLVTQK